MFDHDGVIVDSLAVYHREFARVSRLLGFAQLASLEAFLDLYEANKLESMIARGVPENALPGLLDDLGRMLEEINPQVEPFDGVLEALEALSAGNRIFVITSNVTRVVEDFLSRRGVGCVEGVLGSDLEASKVRKIRATRERFPALEAWYVGDTVGDMIEGRRAGAVTVGVAWGWHGPERIGRGDPDHLVETPGELVRLLGEEAH